MSTAPDHALNLAKEILGEENILGPEDVNEVFGVNITLKDFPLNLNENDLELIKKANCFLSLRIDHLLSKDLSITICSLLNLCRKKIGNCEILDDVNKKYHEESFYRSTRPRLGWYIVSKKPADNASSRDYIKQMDKMIDYLKSIKMSSRLNGFIDLYLENKPGNLELTKLTWSEITKKISELQINKMCRRTPVETLYDSLLFHKKNKCLPSPEINEWTCGRNNKGELIVVSFNKEFKKLRFNGYGPVYHLPLSKADFYPSIHLDSGS